MLVVFVFIHKQSCSKCNVTVAAATPRWGCRRLVVSLGSQVLQSLLQVGSLGSQVLPSLLQVGSLGSQVLQSLLKVLAAADMGLSRLFGRDRS